MRHRYDAPSGETFRLLKYPRGGQDAYKEIVRAGSHSDYGTITLLFQKDVGGLEVHAFDREWISAPLIEGAILVNIGDLMEFWTGGLFKSTKHRVTFLPEHATKDRYSVAYFFQPERDVPITCIPCPKVNQQGSMYTVNGKIMTSIEHLQKRLEAGYGFKSGNIMATGAS
ncbi:hypothetical protein BC940DRAFT_304092 [Gongronella butleri]|nr:hypothetical protein BC940DRAFT_304092 [Gongronella butleri]